MPDWELSGPDGDGFVWLHSGQLTVNLGNYEYAGTKMADWLAEMDFGERPTEGE